MPVQQTSIDAFHESNTIGSNQQKVYEVIKTLGPCCNLDIAYCLRIPINRITPRTNELVKKRNGRRISSSSNTKNR